MPSSIQPQLPPPMDPAATAASSIATDSSPASPNGSTTSPTKISAALALIRRPVSPVLSAASSVVSMAATVPADIASRAGALNASTCTFCGGRNCKYCGPQPAGRPQAIPGLYSAWVTESILAMARPSAYLMQHGGVVEEMGAKGIRCIVNLQQPNEHPQCGWGVLPETGFAYNPEEWIKRGFYYYNFAWEDMNVPTMDQMLSIVKVVANEVASGRKVAVHCHAGLGRTGLAIACYLVYDMHMTAIDAVQLVRTNRPGAVQTPKQAGFVGEFEVAVNEMRAKVAMLPSNCGLYTVGEVMAAHRRLLHGLEARYTVHKFVYQTIKRIHTLGSGIPTADFSNILQQVIDGATSTEEIEQREQLIASFASTQQCTLIRSCTSLPVLLGVLTAWCLTFLKSAPLQLTFSLRLPVDFSDRSCSATRALTLELFRSLHPGTLEESEAGWHLFRLVLYLLTRDLLDAGEQERQRAFALRDQLRGMLATARPLAKVVD
ncbi:protein-tyrosine phosphatase-like protein [Catenaria anguillulae PL171]|uniref:Protein-tyrosine phosphatase-like protein n=1 Tax=Catenaria anguillulae PL171 TaxID=765915 RepID=A0A1Y2HSH7_9FUNG|nr:protein-tyrosine phosphatase-like protein [Catenaria anguillulae PL171]